jgi:hypothetical protein
MPSRTSWIVYSRFHTSKSYEGKLSTADGLKRPPPGAGRERALWRRSMLLRPSHRASPRP